MIYFGLGYGAGIWLGFLVLVLWQLPGHPNPVPFARMFLLLHPLWISALGGELLLAIPREQRSPLQDLIKKRGITRIAVTRAGLFTGSLTSVAAAVFGVLAYFVSPWFAIGVLLVLLFAPVIGFSLLTQSVSRQNSIVGERSSGTNGAKR